MLFYRIDVELSGEPENPDRQEKQERAPNMQTAIDAFFEKNEDCTALKKAREYMRHMYTYRTPSNPLKSGLSL